MVDSFSQMKATVLILHAFETVFKMSGFWFLCFEFPPFLQFLVSMSLSAEGFNCCYLSMCASQHESAMPNSPGGTPGWMGFVSEQAHLTVAMLNFSNKFLLSLPVAVKTEKRRKLTHRKVLTGRLVYDLIFDLFFTNI